MEGNGGRNGQGNATEFMCHPLPACVQCCPMPIVICLGETLYGVGAAAIERGLMQAIQKEPSSLNVELKASSVPDVRQSKNREVPGVGKSKKHSVISVPGLQ